MAVLSNKTKNQVLVENLSIAESFIQRGVGLLGKSTMEKSEALWIKDCFDVHTFFMRFPIDVVFLDEEFHVKQIKRNLKPWRMTFHWGAKSVIEFAGGALTDEAIEVGDELHVGH